MIAEALRKLQELVEQAAHQQEIVIKGESPAVARYVKRDGSIEVLTKVPPLRYMELHTMNDVIALASKPFDEAWQKRVVFFSMSEVVIVLDHANGYELARLKLPETGEVKWLRERVKEPARTVFAMVEAFSTVMRKTRPEQEMARFIDAIGRLATKTNGDAAAEASRGRSGLSKSVVQAVESPEHLPDELQTFHVRGFAVPDLKFRAPVLCTLLPLIQQVAWRFEPVEDSFLDFTGECLMFLRTRLENEVKGVPAFCGRWDVTGK